MSAAHPFARLTCCLVSLLRTNPPQRQRPASVDPRVRCEAARIIAFLVSKCGCEDASWGGADEASKGCSERADSGTSGDCSVGAASTPPCSSTLPDTCLPSGYTSWLEYLCFRVSGDKANRARVMETLRVLEDSTFAVLRKEAADARAALERMA